MTGDPFPSFYLSHVMDPEDLSSFDRLLVPQYIPVLFWVGVAASVLLGLADVVSGIAAEYGGVSLVLWGLATMVGGPVLTRVACELLILAFKVVDWIAEINATLNRQQAQLAEQAERATQAKQPSGRPSPLDESGSGSPEPTSPESTSQTASSAGEPTLPSSR